MADETKFVLRALAAWLCFAAALVISGQFEKAGAVATALTIWGLSALALITLWLSRPARDWLDQADVRSLILPHLTRLVGAYFLWLGAKGQLPNDFARPAGIGDLLIALFATLMLLVRALHRRRILFVWNCLGFADILFVVLSAMRFGLRDWNSMAALRAFPLGLLPTFVVPIIIVTHILIFVRTRRTRQLQSARAASPAASFLQR